MQSTFLTAGIACLIAAIVGGGLKGFGIEIPLLKSVPRQLMLGGFGLVLLILSFVVMPSNQIRTQHQDDSKKSDSVQTSSPAPYPTNVDPEFLREQFKMYEGASDPELREATVRLIREHLMDLAVYKGYNEEQINNADIRELRQIVRDLGVLK